MPDEPASSLSPLPPTSATDVPPGGLASEALLPDGDILHFHVPLDSAGSRLDRWLCAALPERMPDVSRSRLQQWIALGAVHVNGQLRVSSWKLRGYEEITVRPQPRESERAFRPEPIPLQVLYADDDVIVLIKPAGLVTHPAPGHWGGTLLNGLLHAYPRTARLPRAGIVHRLDMDTSGVMVCAHSERGFAALTAQLAERSMGRLYLAVAAGTLREARAVDAPVGRDPTDWRRMAVVPNGRAARTDFLRIDAVTGWAALLCRLHSGRTHQIRVHLSHLGHPIAGDTLYGGDGRLDFPRQALHAWRLHFTHPSGGRTLQFEAPIPEDLRGLLDRLGLVVPHAAPDWPAGLLNSPHPMAT